MIVVPDHLHYEVASDCLREGLHVLLVKPMTPKASEAIDLIEIAQTQKLYGSVEFHKRLDKSNLILKNKPFSINCLYILWSDLLQSHQKIDK